MTFAVMIFAVLTGERGEDGRGLFEPFRIGKRESGTQRLLLDIQCGRRASDRYETDFIMVLRSRMLRECDGGPGLCTDR